MRLTSLIRSTLTVGILALLTGISVAPTQAAKCPNVHIVLDRSGSMSSTLPGGKTRWDVAKTAVTAVLDKYDGTFPIGMSIFPNTGCDAQLVTEPKYRSKMAITMAIGAQGPGGSTPSASAMQSVSMLKALRDPSREQYVILITDGGPGCGAIDTCDGTVNQIDQLLKATPKVTTFVVGFGGGLASDESACLTRMAVAGGKPTMTAQKYYKADSADELNTALSEIIKVVSGGGDVGMGGVCDDTCYSNGCQTPGDICVGGDCKAHPCAGVVCPKDSYCYTDGSSAGVCVKACTKQCPRGTRCNMGSCANDPCPNACPAGTVCDANAKRCVTDPLCSTPMPPDQACKGTSACRAGKCVDDPCRFISCPSGTRCIPWEGTCDWVPAAPVDDPDAGVPGEEDDGTGIRRTGCSTIPGGAGTASFGVAAAYLLALTALRRRRRS
jgi:MYXO-CTERM domain-containing protein